MNFSNTEYIHKFLDNLDAGLWNNLILAIIASILVVGLFLSLKRVAYVRRKVKYLRGDIEKNFIVTRDDGEPVVNNSQKVICIDPYERISEIGGYDIILRHIPSLMTGVGILGTFLGVSIALYSFPEDINNSTQMLAGMKELIPAMKTAFITSLAGISCATFYLLWEKFHLVRIRSLTQMVTEELRNDFYIESPEIYLRHQASLQPTIERMTTAAEGLQATVSNMQGSTTPEMIAELVRDGLAKSIETYLGPPMAGINEKLDALEDVKVSSKSMSDITVYLTKFITTELKGVFGTLEGSIQKSNDAMTVTAQALNETNTALDSLNTRMDKFVTDMGNTLELQERSFRSTIEEVRQSFQTTADTIASQYKDIHSDISHISGTFKAISIEFSGMIDTGNEAFSAQVAGFENMLVTQQETSTAMFSEIRTLNEESMGRVVETTKNTLEDAVNKTRDTAISMIEQAKGDIAAMGDNFKIISGKFTEIMATGTQSFKDQTDVFQNMVETQRTLSSETFTEIRDLNKDSMEQIIRSTKETLNESINKTRDTAIAMIEQAKSDIGQMGEIFQGISSEFSDLLASGNESFGKQVVGFENMLGEQRALSADTFSEIRELNKESLLGIVQTTKDTLEQAIGESRDSAVALIESARDSFEMVVDQANQKLQDTLDGVGGELINTSERVQEELQKFREQYTISLSEFFEKQKDILESILNESILKLSELTDKLHTTFEQEYSKKRDILDRLDKVVSGGTVLTEMQKESIRELASETVDANKQIATSLSATGHKMESINDSLQLIAAAVGEEVTSQIETFAKKQAEVVRTYQVEVDNHLEKVLSHLVSISEILAAGSLSMEDN